MWIFWILKNVRAYRGIGLGQMYVCRAHTHVAKIKENGAQREKLHAKMAAIKRFSKMMNYDRKAMTGKFIQHTENGKYKRQIPLDFY